MATVNRAIPTVLRPASSRRTTREIPKIMSTGVGESTKGILVEYRGKFKTVYKAMNRVKATKKTSKTFPALPPLDIGK